MRVLTTHHTDHPPCYLVTRPSCPSRAPAALAPIAEEEESTAGEGASGEGASSQCRGRVVNLDSESDLDITGVGPVLPATHKATAAEAGAGTGGRE